MTPRGGGEPSGAERSARAAARWRALSFFLTRTDVDSIRQRQLKNGLSLVFLVLVDAGVASLMFFTRERRVRAFVPEVTHLSSAATFKGGTGDLLALVALRASLYACAGALAVTLGKQRNKGPPPPTPPPRSRVGSQARVPRHRRRLVLRPPRAAARRGPRPRRIGRLRRRYRRGRVRGRRPRRVG